MDLTSCLFWIVGFKNHVICCLNVIGPAQRNPHRGAGRSHFIIRTPKAQVHQYFFYRCRFVLRGHSTMGQCGITSSKTVLVFLNLIFWVRKRRMTEQCAVSVMESVSKLANCARVTVRGSETDELILIMG